MRRSGLTLVDLLLGLCLTTMLLAIALQGAGALRDGLAVHAAARAVRDAFALAREQAIAGGARTAVRLGRLDGSVTVHQEGDSLLRLPLGRTHGVSLDATRDSMAYLPSGLGYGGANLRVILRRGTRADSITVSRLGRVR